MITIDGINESMLIWMHSTDEKPTKANGNPKVPNGCMCVVIDKKQLYVYDREVDTWYKWSA